MAAMAVWAMAAMGYGGYGYGGYGLRRLWAIGYPAATVIAANAYPYSTYGVAMPASGGFGYNSAYVAPASGTTTTPAALPGYR